MLKLNDYFLDKMQTHARESYPEECCGFLLGTESGPEKNVLDLLEFKNSSEQNRTRRFTIKPEEYRDAESLAREKGLDVLGLYHSHPDHPARPSQFDLEHALPWWSYVIIEVDRGQPSAIASWLLQEDRDGFAEEQLVITEQLR
jgi:proteasome lid subunit RPN8/RPN11